MFDIEKEFGSDVVKALNLTICPGCGEHVENGAAGCPHCGYENPDDGRLLSVAEIVGAKSYPEIGAVRLNDVSPAFLRGVIKALLGKRSQTGE